MEMEDTKIIIFEDYIQWINELKFLRRQKLEKDVNEYFFDLEIGKRIKNKTL